MRRSSSDNLRQHIILRNCIPEVRNNKNKNQKQIKCGARFKSSAYQYKVKHLKNL
jgi:hypothetical protein